MARRWIVRDGDGTTVAHILDRMESLDALADGRAFVGRQRVTQGEQPVSPGDEVQVHAARGPSDSPRVLGERDGVVAVFKPAALPTVADHRGTRSLVTWAAEQLGLPSVHAASRLDVGVSGVVLLARDQHAQQRLALAREQDRYHRTYLAIAAAAPEPPEGTWSWAIGKTSDQRLRAVDGRGASPAETRYRLLARAPAGLTMLRFEPVTGRTHQLRVHAAHAGLPLLGDTAYGGSPRLVAPSGAITRLARVALHAFQVETPDARGRLWSMEAPVDDELLALWAAAGGAEADWPE
jgi:23S rRNA pseudouridine1911/1915/1917 synthase